jgi:voltage-gated potassium channel
MSAPRPDDVTLRRRSPLPIWAQIGWRVGLVLGLLVLTLAIHWIERGGLKDTHDGHVSFVDVIYFTMISITTTGYGDVVPVTPRARLFDALVVTPIRLFFVLIFIGTAYTFVLRRLWERWRMEKLRKDLCNHVIVAGYGISGAEAVDELVARGTPGHEIVVVDTSAEALQRAASLGCFTADADATRDKSLLAVNIDQARAMIVSAGRDDTSILITLTARHLAPALPISVVIRNEDNELLARQAGATTVINPVSFAGLLLAGSTHGTHLADYIADLASTSGTVQLSEREISADEAGKSLADLGRGLGVRVYRDGRPYGFWEPEAAVLQVGDHVVEIVPTAASEGERGETL